MSIDIILGGDFCPVNSNEHLFNNNDVNTIFGDVLPILVNADYSVFNLECPLTNISTPISKFGPCLKVSTKISSGLSSGLVKCFGLANNHIMDHGIEGVLSTLKVLQDSDIDTFGAGNNLDLAARLLIKDFNSLKVGFLGIAEQEFSIAAKDSHGANPLDLIKNYNSIKQAADKCDYLIIYLHSGNEQYRLPSPRLKELCHFFVDVGADLILCQHSHCVGGYEDYKDSKILYGQGNFIFDFHNDLPGWNEGLLVQLRLAKDKSEIKFIPVFQTPGKPGVELMRGEKYKEFMEGFEKRSALINDDEILAQEWQKYCETVKERYLSDLLSPFSRYVAWLLRRTGLTNLFLNDRAINLLLNLIRCQLHRDVLLTILKSSKK
jgi:hypothetical protein